MSVLWFVYFKRVKLFRFLETRTTLQAFSFKQIVKIYIYSLKNDFIE